MGAKDICIMLEDWPHEPGRVAVRRIVGDDGKGKIQMRVDLGVLQLEEDGRPDGAKPHGHDSLLSYHLKRLREHCRQNDTDLGFALTPEQCMELRREASMYYHRYLAFFGLGEFSKVRRDTERNLTVLDLCVRYALEERDRVILEQFRPFLIAMHTRATVQLVVERQKYRQALAHVDGGISRIRDYYRRLNDRRGFSDCPQVRALRRLRKRICKYLPVNPVEDLHARLRRAVKEERYEDAAQLRDRIAQLERKECASAFPS